MAVRAYLGVSGLDPILIKLMAPEIAPPVVGGVVMTAVQTAGSMWARCSIGRGWYSGVRLLVPLTATGQSPVVFLAVRPPTQGALRLRSVACCFWVTPLAAPLAQGHAWVSPISPERTSIQPKLDHGSEEYLGPSTVDRISNIQIDCGCIGCTGVSDHPRGNLQHDGVFQPRPRDAGHDLLH